MDQIDEFTERIFELQTNQLEKFMYIIQNELVDINKESICALIFIQNNLCIEVMCGQKPKAIFDISMFEIYDHSKIKNIIYIELDELFCALDDSFHSSPIGVLTFYINSNDKNNLHIEYVYGPGDIYEKICMEDTYKSYSKMQCQGRKYKMTLPLIS